jgi:hypothetical protein
MIGLMMLAAAAAGGSHAGPTFLSGDKLLALCRSEPTTCAAYIEGVTDTINSLQDIGALPRMMCQPADATVGHFAVPVTSFLETHPNIGGDGAGGLVWSALIEAYPCPKPDAAAKP